MSTAVDLVGAPRRIPTMGRGQFNGIKEGNTAKRDALEKKLRKELEEREVTSKWEERCSVAKVEDMNVILACLEIEKHRKEEMSKKYEEETEKCKKLEEKVSKLEVEYAVLEDNLSCLVSNFDEERKTFSEWMNEKADLTNQLEQERRKISELPDIFSEHIGRITELMYEKTDLADQLEEERSKVSEYIDVNEELENEKAGLTDQLEEERRKVSELQDNVSEYIDMIAKLENEKTDLADQLEEKRGKVSYLRDNISDLQDNIVDLENEKTDLADQLEEERGKVSDLRDKISGYIDTIMDLENEKTDLADQLEEERGKVSELEDNVSEYIDTIANLENEMANLRKESWKSEDGEQYGWERCVSECTDMSVKSENNEADLANQLEKERRKVGELQDRLTVLEDSEHELRKQCAEIQEGKPNVDSNLEDKEWPIVSKSNYKCPENVSELEDKCATLEQENGDLTHYLYCARQNNTVWVAEKASLQSDKEKLWEMLSQFQADIGAERQRQRDLSRVLEDKRAALEEAQRSVRQFEFADEELNKKVSKLEKRCCKLKEEKKVWAAEKESLVMSLNSQASVVEAYRDMLNKEECLVKLFQNS